jgi:DNA-nicking Smr family endonuclease
VSDRRSAEQEEEFARAMAGVVPLAADPRGRVERAAPAPALRPTDEALAPSGAVPDEYVTPGVDRREIRKLRRGEHTVRARLDLHGMTVTQASTSVGRFIESSRHARYRCVSVIHGKGLNSPGGVSLLKQPVREILMRSPSVLAFASAPPADGGTGAVYVLLRR